MNLIMGPVESGVGEWFNLNKTSSRLFEFGTETAYTCAWANTVNGNFFHGDGPFRRHRQRLWKSGLSFDDRNMTFNPAGAGTSTSDGGLTTGTGDDILARAR